MKKPLIVLCAIALGIAAAVIFWPRLEIPEEVKITLFSHDEDSERVHSTVDGAACAELRQMLDGCLLLPDWTDTFTGQRFHLSAEYEYGFFVEWEGGSVLLYLPRQGTRHLLQLGGDDALIWLDSANLDALKGIFEAQGVFYPPVLER